MFYQIPIDPKHEVSIRFNFKYNCQVNKYQNKETYICKNTSIVTHKSMIEELLSDDII